MEGKQEEHCISERTVPGEDWKMTQTCVSGSKVKTQLSITKIICWLFLINRCSPSSHEPNFVHCLVEFGSQSVPNKHYLTALRSKAGPSGTCSCLSVFMSFFNVIFNFCTRVNCHARGTNCLWLVNLLVNHVHRNLWRWRLVKYFEMVHRVKDLRSIEIGDEDIGAAFQLGLSLLYVKICYMSSTCTQLWICFTHCVGPSYIYCDKILCWVKQKEDTSAMSHEWAVREDNLRTDLTTERQPYDPRC